MIVLYGSGGHAKVVLDCLKRSGKTIFGIFDDKLETKMLGEIPVLGKYSDQIYIDSQMIVTIGNNEIRKKISTTIKHAFGFAIDPSAIVSASSSIGKGCMVLQGVIIQADSNIGEQVILNTRATIEHDCRVGDFVHVGPGATICGLVEIGEGTLIGANATIAPLVKIGRWCQISAGSSVLEDIPDYSIVMGVPGKIVKMRTPIE